MRRLELVCRIAASTLKIPGFKSRDEVAEILGENDWRPRANMTPLAGKDGIKRYMGWTRPATEAEIRSETLEVITNWGSYRGYAGGLGSAVFGVRAAT